MAVDGETVGQAFVRIRADTTGVGDDIRRDLEHSNLDQAGERAGRDFGDGFNRGARRSAKPDDLFGPDFRRRIRSSLKDVDPVLDDFGRNIRSRLRNSLGDTDPLANLGSRMRHDLRDVESVADEFTRNLRSRLRGGLDDLDPFNTRLSAIHQGFTRIRSDADSMSRITDAIREARAASQRFDDENLGGSMDTATRGATRLDRELRRKGPDIDEVTRRSGFLRRELNGLRDAFGAAGGGARRSHSQFSAWVTAIAALGPAIGPLIAAASAALIGLGGAAGVAALGFLGIRDAMKSGTTLGWAYRDMFTGLKTEWITLKSVAAVGFFSGISQGIQAATKVFPALNDQVASLSQTMGHIVGNVGAGFVNLFVQLFPLISKFTDSLARGSQNFLNWSQNSDSFSAFLRYAAQQLPEILDLLRSFAGAFLALVKATAPIGSVIIDVLTGLFDIIAKLGNEAPALLAGVFVVFAAARLAGIVSGITGIAFAIGRLGLAMRVLAISSVIGVVLAGIAAAVSVFSGKSDSATQSAQQFDAAMQDLNATLKDSGGAVNESVLGKAVDIGLTPAVANVLKGLGVSATEFGTAIVGTDKQWQTFRASIAQGFPKTLIGRIQLGQLDLARKQFLAGKLSAQEYAKAQADIAKQLAKANPELASQAGILGATVPAMLAAADAATKQADKQKAATLAMQAENDAAGLLKASLDALNGKTLSAAEANTAFHSSLLTMNKTVKDGVKAGISYTEKGLATRGAIESQVDAAKSAASALGDLKDSTSAGAKAYKQYAAQILDNIAKDRGLTTAQQRANDKVFQYAKNLLKAGSIKVKPTVLEVETAKAAGSVTKLQTLITNIKQGKVPGIDANTDQGKNVIRALQRMIDNIRQHGRPVIDANTGPGSAKIRSFQHLIDGIVRTFTATVDVNTDAGMAALQALSNDLRTLAGSSVETYIDVIVRTHPNALPRNAGAIRALQGGMAGRIVDHPQIMQVGERGLKEAIVPLQLPLNQVNPEVRGMAALLRGQQPKGMQNGGIVGGGKTINATINVTPQAADPEAVSWSVLNRLTVLGR